MFKVPIYKDQLPKEGSLVFVKYTSVDPIGAYCTLIEYGNVQGLVISSELSRKKYVNISKLVKIGKTDIVQVLRIDSDGQFTHIDLSKKRVSELDIEQFSNEYAKTQMAHTLVHHLIQKYNLDPKEVYTNFVYPLVDNYGSLFNWFELVHASKSIDSVQTYIQKGIVGLEFIKDLQTQIGLRIVEHQFQAIAYSEVYCFGPEGIDAVKRALILAKQETLMQWPDYPLQITLWKNNESTMPSCFRFACVGLKKGILQKVLEQGLETAKTQIESTEGGVYNVVKSIEYSLVKGAS